MGIVQYADLDALFQRQILLHRVDHLFCKRTGIADGRPLGDARREGNGVGAAVHHFPRPGHGPFARTAAAIDEADDFDVFIDAGKSAFFIGDGFKIPCAGALILGLHTANNAYFHTSFLSTCFTR